MNPIRTFVLSILSVAASVTSAEPPREQVLRPWDGLNERGERQTNMEAVEAARDRGDGRISNEATWQLDRIDAWQNNRYIPGRDARLFEQERDRQLRIEARARRQRSLSGRIVTHADAIAEEADLGIVPADLTPRAGLSPLAAQLYDDEQTMTKADEDLSRMIGQLDEAESRELGALRDRLEREGRAGEFDAAAAKVKADYVKWRTQARDEREKTRSRIVGEPPATRPAATQPAEPSK